MVTGLITANDIASIKGSGVVTKIVDNTRQRQVQPQGIVRLVYGFSKIGIYNRAVFLEAGDKENANDIFGGIDKQLERKGSWFHRAIDIALEEGAVLALNLLKTDDSIDELTGLPTLNADIAQYKSFSVAPSNANSTKKNKLYSSYFKKDRFWKPDENFLLATRDSGDQGSILNLTNLSQGKLTFFAIKSTVSGFDVTIKDWYADNVSAKPAFTRDSDYVSDYFLDVYAVAGDYSNYDALSTDIVMSKYFDKQGLKIEKFSEFLGLAEVNLVRQFQGSIIPNFRDKNGAVKSIDQIINSGTDYHGVLCAIDKKELDKFELGTNTKSVDLVGHDLLNNVITDMNFLSYKRKLSKDSQFSMSNPSAFSGISMTGVTITSNTGYIEVTISNLNPSFSTIVQEVVDGTILKGELTAAGIAAGIPYANPILEVYNAVSTASLLTFRVTNLIKDSETLATGSFVELVVEPATIPVSTGTGSIEVLTIPQVGVDLVVGVKTDITVITFGTVPIILGDTPTSVAANIATLINAGTGTHGYIASPASAVVTLTHNTFDGKSHNGDIPFTETIIGVGQSPLTFNLVNLTGGIEGVKAGLQYDDNITGLYLDSPTQYVSRKNDLFYLAYGSGELKNGVTILTPNDTIYLAFEEARNPQSFELQLIVTGYADAEFTTVTNLPIGTETLLFDMSPIMTLNMINVVTSSVEISKNISVTTQISQSVVRIDAGNNGVVKIGQYLEGIDGDGNKILVRITSVKNIGSPVPTELEVTVDGVFTLKTSITGGYFITRYIPLKESFDHLQAFYLKGLELKESHMPNNTNQRMKEILSVMIDTPIRKALVDPDMITFRYIVDTFNHGLEPSSKRDITMLARDRRKAIALLNTPSTSEFFDSLNPRFTDEPTAVNPLPTLQVKHIASGANLDLNPDFLYTRPDEVDGASYAAYFYPNINKLDDDLSPLSVPPALYVSNNFVRKWKDGNGFKATAGTTRGVITGEGVVGLDHALDKTDRGLLEDAGINPLRQYEDGTIAIYGNQTAYTKFRSILNQVNSRDTLITIETDIERILDGFVFEEAFSDDTIRTTITESIQLYLNNLRDGQKAIISGTVKFDRQNNPDWVVAESAAIVDITVELPTVTRKFISRITLTGGAAVVGAFTAV